MAGVLSPVFSQTDTIGKLTTFYYASGKKSSEGIIRDNKPDGFWKSWYENGNLKSEGLRTGFLLDSIWNFYYENGKIHQRISYRNDQKNGYTETWVNEKTTSGDSVYYMISKELFLNGIRQGESFYYHRNGTLQMSIYYRSDKRHGKGREFDDRGHVISLFEYFNGYLIENIKINRLDSQGRKQGRWIAFFENGEVFTDISYMNDKMHGYYREYNSSGILVKEMRYLNGEPVTRDMEDELKVKADVRTQYNSNGSLKFTGAFLNNNPVGVHKEYDENGNLAMAKEYDEFGTLLAQGLFDAQGNRTGKWTFFYDDGSISGKGSYQNNQKTGTWEFFYRDGKPEQKGDFVNDKPEGYWVLYYISGAVLREENYHFGKREGEFTEFDEAGNIITKGEYFDGYKMGEWFYHVGDHTEIGSFENGFKTGKWKHYYLNDKLSFEGEFRGGDPTGKHVFYYEDGSIYITGFYRAGKKHGSWKRFNPDGTLFSVYTYKNGKLQKIDNKKIDDTDADIFKEELPLFQN